MATKLRANGTTEIVAPAGGAAFTLDELQAAVGGYIELLGLNDGRLLVLNEDGKRLRLPWNRQATILARRQGYLPPWDVIVGDVVVGTRAELGGR
jgi:Domain of unknown function (DUF3846)